MTNRDVLKVGVVGYCPPTKFDIGSAERMINDAYERIMRTYFDGRDVVIVSGLTNVGVLAIAYEAAVERGWKTIGIACKRAEEHKLFPVDEKIIVGENWGDESETFLNSIEILIRIGDGPQSLEEDRRCRADGKVVLAYNLEAL